MFVLPTESFRDYVEHPQVRRMYLTDVGFFPVRHTIIGREGMGLKRLSLFTVRRAVVPLK